MLLACWAGPVAALTPHQEARALLDRWLQAQNEVRFDEYQTLYGGGFEGVRRSGNRTAHFDRAGWLQDRKRMFEKPMTVVAENVHIYASARAGRIVFTQRWSSGHYTDTGPKQLVLRHGPDGFRIDREELFASDRSEPGTIDLEAFHRFAFVVDGEVVVTMQAEDSWGKDSPRIEKRGKDRMLVRSRRAVDSAKLPPGVAALVGTTVRLMDARGVRCEAKLGAFWLRGRVFTEPFDDGDPDKPTAEQPAEIDRTEIWNMSPHYLVASVVGDRRACAGATWARAAALPAAAIATAAAVPPELAARALVAFQALPASTKLQREFAQFYAKEHPGEPAPLWFKRPRQKAVIRVISPAGRPALLSVSARIDEGGCEDGVFGGIWAVWELDDRGPAPPRLILRNQPDGEMFLKPTAAVDVDGDGTAALLFDSSTDYGSANASGQFDYLEHGIVSLLDGVYVRIVGPQTPIYGCPC